MKGICRAAGKWTQKRAAASPLSLTKKLTAAVGLMLIPVLASCANKDLNSPACDGSEDFGVEVGDYVQNFRLVDQNDEEVFLSDYCGDVVVIQMGAMWCPSCQAEAEKIPSLMDKYGDDGFIVLSLMTETPDGSNPKPRDLGSWAVTFDLETPVLADEDWEIWDRYFEIRATPRALLMDRDGKLAVRDWVVTEAQIEDAL